MPSRKRASFSRKFKKKLTKALVAGVNRFDFIRFLEKVSASPRAVDWAELYGGVEPQWAHQEELVELSIRLTREQLKAEGFTPKEENLRNLAEAISVNYDRDIHEWGLIGLTTLLSCLFTHQDPAQPFLSPDGRDTAHVDLLRSYQDQGLGVVYLVNHSTHLDEFLVDAVTGFTHLKLPIFAAGQNMMAIDSLAVLLRAGSYVVQRRGSTREGLASLFNYCRAISETGSQQGIFLEAWHGGARSRDGGLRYPRRLVTLRGALACEKDLVVQPVALSYAIVPEDLSLAARKGGRCWVRGAGPGRFLGNLLLHPRSFLWRTAKDLYGRAYVTMPKPLLLSELKEVHEQDRQDLELDEFVGLTAINEIARTKKIMASQLVARGLNRVRHSGLRTLGEAVKREMDNLTEYHQATFGHDPDFEDFIRENKIPDVVEDGLLTLRQRGIISSTSSIKKAARPRPGKPSVLPTVLTRRGLAFYATHCDRRIYSPTANQNIVVVGAGDWGFALTYLIGRRILDEKRYLNASLTLFDPRPGVAAEMNIERAPTGRFEDLRLPRNAFATGDPQNAFRQASEVVLIAPPAELPDQARMILEHSEQALKLVVATCSFEPASNRLPCQLVMDLAAEMGRTDVEVYALAGPVDEAQLVALEPVTGVLAGPAAGVDLAADLFALQPVEVIRRSDPIGVQIAVIMARIYALWGNVQARSGELKGAAALGIFMARAAAETAKFGAALGAEADSFSADDPAWSGTFIAEGISGPSHRFGRKLGATAKKKESLVDPARKLFDQMRDSGIRVTGYLDLKPAFRAARELDLDLPILNEAYQGIFGE